MAQNTWFECKIQYEKTMEDGTQKKVTEPYLVDALSFTEAEARIMEETEPFVSGEYTVSDIRKTSYSELFDSTKSEDDRWFKAKLMFVTVDEKSGKEKKKASAVMVKGKNLGKALANLSESMKKSMADYEVAAIQETAIMDVFAYRKK